MFSIFLSMLLVFSCTYEFQCEGTVECDLSVTSVEEDPLSCFHMYKCVQGAAERVECPGMAYDPKMKKCTWSEAKVCENHRLKNKLAKAFVWEGIADQFGDKVFDCDPGNYFRLPHTNCSLYYQCYDGDKTTLQCDKGYFSPEASTCNWSESVCREEDDNDDYYEEENDLRIVIGEEAGKVLWEDYESEMETPKTTHEGNSEHNLPEKDNTTEVEEPVEQKDSKKPNDTIHSINVPLRNGDKKDKLKTTSKLEIKPNLTENEDVTKFVNTHKLNYLQDYNNLKTSKLMDILKRISPKKNFTQTTTIKPLAIVTNPTNQNIDQTSNEPSVKTKVKCEPLERVIDPVSCTHYYECISGRFQRQECPDGEAVSFTVGWRRPACSSDLQMTICAETHTDEVLSTSHDGEGLILTGVCDKERDMVADPRSTAHFYTCVEGGWQRRFCGDHCFSLFQVTAGLPT